MKSHVTLIDSEGDHNGNLNQNNGKKLDKSTDSSFVYPACWQDEQRMSVLMAPFRLRSVNPEHYDAKLKFWVDLIRKYCEHNGAASFSKNELTVVFTREYRIPYALDTVLEEMGRAKQIRLRSEYEYDPKNSWAGWTINSFVKKPAYSLLYKMKSIIGLTIEAERSSWQYVYLELVTKYCKELQENILKAQQGKLLHYDIVKELATKSLHLTEDCLKLCLCTLQAERKIGVAYKIDNNEQHMHLIKIPSLTNASVAITEIDHAFHNLQMTQKSLQSQLVELETEIKSHDEKLRQSLLENKRSLAKTYLRKKHLQETNFEKRSLALHNIETMMSSIEDAQCNGEIFHAYSFGSKALQNALNQSGLNYNNVDEVLSEVRETIDTHKEVDDMLSNTTFSDDVPDMDELERELMEIYNETVKTADEVKPTDDESIAKMVGALSLGDNATPKSNNVKMHVIID